VHCERHGKEIAKFWGNIGLSALAASGFLAAMRRVPETEAVTMIVMGPLLAC
jgi:hypothetical protein